MRDFTVEVMNLPEDHIYGGKEVMLKAYIWEHMETHVRAAFEEKHIKANNKAKLEELAKTKPWQVVDVNFTYLDETENTLLTELDVADRAKKTNIHALKQIQKGPNPEE